MQFIFLQQKFLQFSDLLFTSFQLVPILISLLHNIPNLVPESQQLVPLHFIPLLNNSLLFHQFISNRFHLQLIYMVFKFQLLFGQLGELVILPIQFLIQICQLLRQVFVIFSKSLQLFRRRLYFLFALSSCVVNFLLSKLTQLLLHFIFLLFEILSHLFNFYFLQFLFFHPFLFQLIQVVLPQRFLLQVGKYNFHNVDKNAPIFFQQLLLFKQLDILCLQFFIFHLQYLYLLGHLCIRLLQCIICGSGGSSSGYVCRRRWLCLRGGTVHLSIFHHLFIFVIWVFHLYLIYVNQINCRWQLIKIHILSSIRQESLIIAINWLIKFIMIYKIFLYIYVDLVYSQQFIFLLCCDLDLDRYYAFFCLIVLIMLSVSILSMKHWWVFMSTSSRQRHRIALRQSPFMTSISAYLIIFCMKLCTRCYFYPSELMFCCRRGSPFISSNGNYKYLLIIENVFCFLNIPFLNKPILYFAHVYQYHQFTLLFIVHFVVTKLFLMFISLIGYFQATFSTTRLNWCHSLKEEALHQSTILFHYIIASLFFVDIMLFRQLPRNLLRHISFCIQICTND